MAATEYRAHKDNWRAVRGGVGCSPCQAEVKLMNVTGSVQLLT